MAELVVLQADATSMARNPVATCSGERVRHSRVVVRSPRRAADLAIHRRE